MPSLTGVDVSSFQPDLDWNAVASAGASFGIAKCTEGSGYADPSFRRHWDSIKAAGLVRGAYHFSRYDLGTTPSDEAQWFLKNLPNLEPGDFVVLDIENPPTGALVASDLSSWALAWLSVVEHAIGFRPFVYSGADFAQHHLTDARLAVYPLWVAAYGPNLPSVPPWTLISMWQHTDEAVYAGRHVDESYFFGSAEALRALGKPSAGTKPSPVPQKPPWDGVRRFELIQAMQLRPLPALWCPKMGARLPKGTIVAASIPTPPLPPETTHWIFTRTGGDVRGYLYKENLRQVTP